MTAQPLHEVRSQSQLFESILELIRRTSTQLPDDVVHAVNAARGVEKEGSNAAVALNVIGCNIGLARESSLPRCQDTGTILDCVLQAQGQGCGPGILGVCIGGDRGTGYAFAKEQLLRTMDNVNDDPQLAELEERIVQKANQSGIGPMGFGGKTTLLGCKIGKLNRLPASFFVSIAYMCWAFRRRGFTLDLQGAVMNWLY